MKVLARSTNDRILFGVCGGLGEYLDIDSTLIRLIFILIGFMGGGILIYLALAVIMPNGTEDKINNPALDRYNMSNANKIFSIFIIFLGCYLLLNNLHIIRFINYSLFFSGFIIFTGISLIITRKIYWSRIFALSIIFMILISLIFFITSTTL